MLRVLIIGLTVVLVAAASVAAGRLVARLLRGAPDMHGPTTLLLR